MKGEVGLFALGLFWFFISASEVWAQGGRVAVGLEQDALPYLTKGYFGEVWVGSGHLRTRALTAHATRPDAFVKEGFTNNTLTAYALLLDYFVSEGWVGWWIGAGPVYWRSSIEAAPGSAAAGFDSFLLNGSIGYSFDLGKHFSVTPWGGLHLRVGGPAKVGVAGKLYEPTFLNPEASVKVGWWL